MNNRSPVWWAVLSGGAVLMVTALVLAFVLAPRTPADFGSSELARTEDAGAVPAGGPSSVGGEHANSGGEHANSSADPGGAAPRPRATTLPLVPPEARGPAQVMGERPAAPTGLQIPLLDVAVEVVPVGIDDEGLMEIPASGQDVGWYRFGPSPGTERGSAVLASHVNTRAEGAGVLARLGELRPGERLTVTLEDGSAVDYVVTDRRTVAKTELDERALFDRTGPARLALVTCGGPWLEAESSYRDNIIVLAEPVAPSS